MLGLSYSTVYGYALSVNGTPHTKKIKREVCFNELFSLLSICILQDDVAIKDSKVHGTIDILLRMTDVAYRYDNLCIFTNEQIAQYMSYVRKEFPGLEYSLIDLGMTPEERDTYSPITRDFINEVKESKYKKLTLRINEANPFTVTQIRCIVTLARYLYEIEYGLPLYDALILKNNPKYADIPLMPLINICTYSKSTMGTGHSYYANKVLLLKPDGPLYMHYDTSQSVQQSIKHLEASDIYLAPLEETRNRLREEYYIKRDAFVAPKKGDPDYAEYAYDPHLYKIRHAKAHCILDGYLLEGRLRSHVKVADFYVETFKAELDKIKRNKTIKK